MCLSTLICIMIEWKRKIYFFEFALLISTFLADIYIMIELKQEIFCLYLHYRHSLFSWHLYYDRVKARNLLLVFALQMSTFLADIYIMIEWKQEIFFLEFALQMSTFLADIYIMIEWRPIIISLLLFPLTFPITSFIPSLMFSKTKKPPCFHRTGKRQIIEGDMTESKFPSLLLLFFLIRVFKWISSSIQLGRFKIKRFERELAERIFVPLLYSL